MANPNDQDNKSNLVEPQAFSAGGGNGRQGIGQAFVMSMIRQIARSIGSAIVRAVIGRSR